MRHIARWAASRWQWAVLLLGLPLVLTMVVPDWMYSQTDFIDSWVYYGFFRHLEAYSVSMFPQTYYGTRLGWIVPGYLAYRLFTPFEATLILHLVFYCLAVGSLFVIVRRVSGSSSGLFAALAFGLYLPTVRALGSDYVDGAVIAYALLTVAFGLRGVEESKRVWTLASGIAAGLMLNSNIGAVLLFPSLVVWFVPRQLAGWRSLSLWVHAVLWAVGIALATAVLVAISVATGGDWDFFLNSLRWMRGQQGTNPWDVTGLSWVAASPWVFLPPATLLGTLLVWLRSRHDRLNAGQIKAIGSLGLVATVFVLFDFVGSGALLYWPFYASWLIPFTFLAIGVVLVPAARDFRTEAATLLVLVVGLGVSLAWPQFTRLPLFGLRGFALIVILVGVAALARSVVGSRIALAAAIFCLHGWLTLTNTYLPSRDRADVFQTVDRAVGFMEYFITDSQPRFLLTPPRKLGHYVQALTSVYLWGYTIASDRYPAVTAAQAALILPGATVVVISEEDGAASGFDEVFAPYGLSGAVKGSERVETIHGPLYLTVLYAKPRSGS